MNNIWTGIELAIRPYISYFLSPTGNLMFSLMIFILFVVLYFLGRHWLRFRRIEKNRRAIPLVIGGWGTRGKSGTERLKAALFMSQGYKVIAKTTGSAAMFLRNVPGHPPQELFLFRPYDKASIWEQMHTLELAAQSKAQVFLWECMALNQRYVDILQNQWMRDDCSTITNAYADHEDIQGPAGMDVAEVIATFIPQDSQIYSSEVQMLPILQQEARRKGTELHAVPERDAALLPQQLLERFPYQEHPSNIALVGAVAESYAISREEALFDMADNVVPEIGVLKVFPEATVRGRRIRFINGMSANERTGFLNNWRRTGFDKIGKGEDHDHWAVTMVNNRADRIARSQVFARILTEDIHAHRHILVGTNLRGLRGYLSDALSQHLESFQLLNHENLIHHPEQEFARALVRIGSQRRRRRLAESMTAGVLRMASVLHADDEQLVSLPEINALQSLQKTWLSKVENLSVSDLEQNIRRDGDFCSFCVGERRRFIAEDAARHLVFDYFEERLSRMADSGNIPTESQIQNINQLFITRLRELFMRSILIVQNSNLNADALIRRIAEQCPPAYRASIIGIQNIKGPGLEMVFRWRAYETVTENLTRLDSPTPQTRLNALTRLQAFEDYGLLDSLAALEKIGEILREDDESWASLKPSLKKLQNRLLWTVQMQEDQIGRKSRIRPVRWLISQIESILDFVGSIARTRRADRITRDLLSGRISQRRAAAELRHIAQQQKGGWLNTIALPRRRPFP